MHAHVHGFVCVNQVCQLTMNVSRTGRRHSTSVNNQRGFRCAAAIGPQRIERPSHRAIGGRWRTDNFIENHSPSGGNDRFRQILESGLGNRPSEPFGGVLSRVAVGLCDVSGKPVSHPNLHLNAVAQRARCLFTAMSADKHLVTVPP